MQLYENDNFTLWAAFHSVFLSLSGKNLAKQTQTLSSKSTVLQLSVTRKLSFYNGPYTRHWQKWLLPVATPYDVNDNDDYVKRRTSYTQDDSPYHHDLPSTATSSSLTIFFLIRLNKGHWGYLLVVIPEEVSPPLSLPLSETRESVIDEHPIERLMEEEVEDAYRAKLSRQSKMLEAAIQQYKKRYQHDPPRGFDEWGRLRRRTMWR